MRSHNFGLITALLCSAACASQQMQDRPPCRDITLGALVAECTAKIVKACAGKDYDTCPDRDPMQRDCERQIDDWESCR